MVRIAENECEVAEYIDEVDSDGDSEGGIASRPPAIPVRREALEDYLDAARENATKTPLPIPQSTPMEAAPVKVRWLLDSGTSQHMTNKKAILVNLKTYTGPPVGTAGSQTLPAEAVGSTIMTIQGETIQLDDVLYVPHISTNILSPGQLFEFGGGLSWKGGDTHTARLRLPGRPTLKFEGDGRRVHIEGVHHSLDPRRPMTALVDLSVHESLGHPGPQSQKTMMKALRIPAGDYGTSDDCDACRVAKSSYPDAVNLSFFETANAVPQVWGTNLWLGSLRIQAIKEIIEVSLALPDRIPLLTKASFNALAYHMTSIKYTSLL